MYAALINIVPTHTAKTAIAKNNIIGSHNADINILYPMSIAFVVYFIE